jgi:hypothetical protein
MSAPRGLPSGKGKGPAWAGLLVTGVVILLAAVIIGLIIAGPTPAPFQRPPHFDITLPQPGLPDTPRLPDGPVVPPVDPRVDAGPGG